MIKEATACTAASVGCLLAAGLGLLFCSALAQTLWGHPPATRAGGASLRAPAAPKCPDRGRRPRPAPQALPPCLGGTAKACPIEDAVAVLEERRALRLAQQLPPGPAGLEAAGACEEEQKGQEGGEEQEEGEGEGVEGEGGAAGACRQRDATGCGCGCNCGHPVEVKAQAMLREPNSLGEDTFWDAEDVGDSEDQAWGCTCGQ